MPDTLDAYLNPPAAPRSPRERVHSIAAQVGIDPAIADDYLKLTRVESGHNVKVRDSQKGAQGFGQVMPDSRGGTTRTVSGRKFNLRDPDQNIEAGLRYFNEGGSDPVARRLHYFGGPRARQTYERTGKIPNVSDGNMTATQYVQATGAQRQQRKPPNDLDNYLDPQPPGQTPPTKPELDKRAAPPDTAAKRPPAVSPASPSVPTVQRRQRATPQPAPSMSVGELRRQDDAALAPRTTTRQQIIAERKARRGAYGAPTAKGLLALAANPIGSFTDLLFHNEDDIVQRETEERLAAAERARSLEVTQIRQEYGQMSPTKRSVVAPLARGSAGLLKVGAGITSLGGLTPNQLSDWANKRGQVVEEAASLPPLTAELKETERRLPEKVATALADVGVGVGEIVLLKKATNLSFPQLLALEGALKANDKPLAEQSARAAEGYALGRVLDQHLGRSLSAAAFAGPAAVQSGSAVAEGRMSPEDALIQTGVQAGAGVILGGGRRQRGLQEKTESPVAQERAAIESAATATEAVPARPVVDRENAQVEPARGGEPARTGASGADEQPQRFYHRDYGEVVESPSQRRVGKGRVRVVAEDGSEHVIKRASLTGAGNQRAVPIRSPVAIMPLVPEQVLRTNHDLITAPEFRQHVLAESVSGNAGEGRAAVNAAIDKQGRVVQFGNRQDFPEDVQRKLDSGEYSQASFIVKDVLTDEPVVERVVLSDTATGSGQLRAAESKWFVDLEDPAKSKGDAPPEFQGTAGAKSDVEPYLEPVSPPVESRTEPVEAQVVRPWEMTREQIEVEFQRKKAEDDDIEVTVLGPELAQRYKRLQRTANSAYDTEKADRASDEIERIEASLSERDRNRLYGIGEEGPQVEDLRNYRQSLGNLDDSDPQSLAESMRWAISRVGNESDPLKMTHEQQVAYGTLREAARIAYERGWDTQAISREAVKSAAGRFGDPEDAKFVLDRFLKKEPAAREPARQMLPPAPEEPQVVKPESVAAKIEPPQSATAAKKSAMSADRAALDLPELPAPERKSWAKSLDEAKPERASLLADEVLNRPRSLNDSETASLVVRAQEIKNEHAAKMREIGEAADAETITAKRGEVEALEREFDRLTRATKASGTEKGRTLAAQKLTINQDYDLVSLVQRAKAAKGRDLTTEERTRYEQQAARISELESQLASAQVKAQQRTVDSEIRKVSRQRQRSETRAILDTEYAQLRTDFTAARAEVRNVQPSGLASLDPEGRLTPLLARMAKNRIKAGINSTEALVSELYNTVKDHGWSRDDVLGVICNTIHESDDVLSRWDKTRQAQLVKQQVEMEQRLASGDYSKPTRAKPAYTRETLRLQKEVEEIKIRYNRELYRATRGRGGMITDELAKAANVPKTLKSIGDVSAMFRQGGYYAITHPVSGLAKPTRAMLQSFTDLGWRNVEAQIKADPMFAKLRDAGVEFTGVDQADPRLSRREEGYLGGEYLDLIGKGKYNLPGKAVKGIKDFSERTFVSFLDAQRLHVGKAVLEGMTPAQRSNPAEVKAVARLVNIATGRGSLGRRGNQLAPALNIAMFSPRLLASRVQLLNNMINPVTIARMPAGARWAMIADNVKFLAATGAFIGLAKAAGATVSTDPDDAEFLKIRVGNTVYDNLTGLQQPLRYIVNMTRGASPVDSRALQAGPSMYSGRSMAEMSKQFARSKANPALAPLLDFVAGEDFEGRKFSARREAVDLVTPLPAKDVYEGLKEGGIIGGVKATPTFVGVGVGSYPPAPDKPKTHAEKLARKLLREGMPDTAREEEQIDIDRQKSQLRTRSRAGENVNAELVKLVREGEITDKQAKRVAQAKGHTRLSEDIKTLDAAEALRVYSVMNSDERRVSAASIKHKIANSKADAAKKAKFKQRARELGLVQ